MQHADVTEQKRMEAADMETIGRANRSHLLQLKSLKILAIESIVGEPGRAVLSSKSLINRPYNLSPVLRKEILEHVKARSCDQAWFALRELFHVERNFEDWQLHLGVYMKSVGITTQQQNAILERKHPRQGRKLATLLEYLLNETVQDFDFQFFPQQDFQLELKTWKLLAERCPNVQRVSDSRRLRCDFFRGDAPKVDITRLNLRPILSFVVQMTNLLHLDLIRYVLVREEEMQLISQHLPNLRSFCFSMERCSFDFMKSLFCLQKLEVLRIDWKLAILGDGDQATVRSEQTQIMSESLLHLPLLRVCCADNTDLTVHRGSHTIHASVRLEPSLPCEFLNVREYFPLEHFPFVKSLRIQKSFQGQFPRLANLESLQLMDDVNSASISRAITAYGSQLQELVLKKDNLFDVYEIFLSCPNLRKAYLKIVSRGFQDFAPRNVPLPPFHPNAKIPLVQQLSDVDSEEKVSFVHFRQLEHFKFNDRASVLPPRLAALVLCAPGLKYFSVFDNLVLKSDDLIALRSLLVERRILQQLEFFAFGWKSSTQCVEMESFLAALPAFAPKLRFMKAMVKQEMKNHLHHSILPLMHIPDFHYDEPINFNNLLVPDQSLDG